MIYILIFALIFLLWISYIFNDKNLIAPSFIFCISFIFSSIWAGIYSKKWMLDLHTNTFLVIFGGVAEFIFVCFFVQCIFRTQTYYEYKDNIKKIQISNSKKIAFIIFCIFSIIYMIYSIVRAVKGSFNDIGAAIGLYKTVTMFTDEKIPLPRFVTYSRYIINAAGYWFAYVVINNYLVEKKMEKK